MVQQSAVGQAEVVERVAGLPSVAACIAVAERAEPLTEFAVVA